MATSDLPSLNPLKKPAATPVRLEADALAASAAESILRAVGEDLAREGLQRTPARYAKALREIAAGYAVTLEEAIGQGVFAAEGKGLVSVRDVDFYSMCEHHMLPFYGRATVAYYPADRILGLSKIPRIIEMFARRFQVQERLSRQIGEALLEAVLPRAVAVRLTGTHMCMMMRGVEKQGSTTVTEFIHGADALTTDERSRLFAALDGPH